MCSFKIIEKVPSPETYMYLRDASGMPPRTIEGAKKGLGNELYSVLLVNEEDNETIGMGRLVGDGGTVFQICDMAVIVKFQNKGGGTMIMNALMEFIEEKKSIELT